MFKPRYHEIVRLHVCLGPKSHKIQVEKMCLFISLPRSVCPTPTNQLPDKKEKYFSFRHPVEPFQALRWNENISPLPPKVKSRRKRRDKKTNLNKLLIREVISREAFAWMHTESALPVIFWRLLGTAPFKVFNKLRTRRRLTPTLEVSGGR